jgi:hypothetical protein
MTTRSEKTVARMELSGYMYTTYLPYYSYLSRQWMKFRR